jgi:hypothetical protein
VPPVIKKYKYFSKKNKHYEGPKHKPYNSGKTVEVFLFDNKTDPKARQEPSKSFIERTPLNKNVESIFKVPKVKKSSSKPKICLPVYQNYINQVKKVGTCSKLKELHKKMRS